MKKFLNEFKEFAVRGNVLDLAVGVIIGAAFKSIVDSVVNDIFMPAVGILIGGHDFSALSVTVGTATIKYGSLIQNIVNFVIVAFCLFLFVKFFNKFKNGIAIKKHNEEKAEEEKKDENILLLEQIRDALVELNKNNDDK